MSHAKADSAESLVAVARAVKVRGLKGEIVSELLTDFPERFEGLEQLVALSPGGERKIVKLEGHWLHQQRIVLKFVGFDSVEAAKTLIGCEFAVPEADRVLLPEDYFYHWELEGCSVKTVVGSEIGNVREVMRTGGVELLVVKDNTGKDHLVPMVASIIVEVDISRKSIVIDPPEGLLEL
jgi:16S rRNA processing protein RimM